MKVTPRELARRVLRRVDQGAYTTLALAGELGRSRLSELDRGLTTELVYGVLKRRLRLDHALSSLAPRGLGGIDGPTLDTLRMAAYQILFLRTADHAAVDDAVEAIKQQRGDKLAGFGNALLRRLCREGEPPLPPSRDPNEALALAESTPRWIVDRVVPLLGLDGTRELLARWNAPAPTWLRANTLRTSGGALAARLAELRPGASVRPSLLCTEAVSVTRGGDIFSSELYGEGAFIAQDLGAQVVAHLLDPQPGERILDACCGVGGKSTHLAALTANQATIDAADLSARKLELCADHARRLGAQGLRFIEADLTAVDAATDGNRDDKGGKVGLAPSYDRVLLDAPCSGLGVLRRHPELKWRRREDELRDLVALQKKLLDAVARRVRPGGVLVYSVCTFTDEEGPQQLRTFLATHPDFHLEPLPATLTALRSDDGGLRTWPHRDDADAFYAFKLRRDG